ncbi:MAG: DUF4190 domain-containing protein [Armatimonadota bacterium]
MNERSATNTAVIALVLGVLSLVGLSVFAGLPAWILGRAELRRIAAGEASVSGRGLALTGMILGIISTVLAVVAVIVALLLVWALQPTVDLIQEMSAPSR